MFQTQTRVRAAREGVLAETDETGHGAKGTGPSSHEQTSLRSHYTESHCVGEVKKFFRFKFDKIPGLLFLFCFAS